MSELIAGAGRLAPVFYRRLILLSRLKIYEVNPIYVKYLSSFQKHIFSSEHDKKTRKYIGIILRINDCNYFAPLSSFKPKHAKMKEGVDFIKIKDYAVININNMIPVPKGEYKETDINGTKDEHYRYLLQAESREINRQKNRIIKNADIVYRHKLRNNLATPLANRTNDFVLLEKACKDY